MTAYAYCRPWGKRLVTVSGSTTLGSNDDGTVTASCPSGTRAISGGFEGLSSGGIFLIHSSHRTSQRTWSATGVNFGSGTVADFTAPVYCVEGGKRLKVDSASTTVPAIAGGVYGTAATTAKCPKRRRVLSGGFEGTVSDGTTIGDVFPHTSRKAGARRWRVEAINSSMNPGELTAYAYCEKRRK